MRWLRYVSFSLAVLLAVGGDAFAQAPGRSGARTRPAEVERAGDDDDFVQPAGRSSAWDSAEPRRRSAEAQSRAEGSAPRATRGRRPSASQSNSVLPASAVEDPAESLPDDVAGADDNPDPGRSVLMPRARRQEPGRMQLAFGEDLEQQEAVPDEDLRKQLDLQQKEIDILEKMVRLTADQVKRQGPSLEELESWNHRHFPGSDGLGHCGLSHSRRPDFVPGVKMFRICRFFSIYHW